MKRRLNGLALAMMVPLLAQTTLALAESCEAVLPRLEERYNRTTDTCPGQDGEPQAAHFCSGLVLRGVKRPEEFGQAPGSFYPFQTSPNAQTVGSSAATYARADIPFADLVIGGGETETTYSNGMVIRSAWDTPDPANRVYIECAFPADAWAYDRGDKGCGDNRKTPEVEGRCQDRNVDGKNWAAQFLAPNVTRPENIGGLSCAFDLRTENGAESSKSFSDFLEARRSMNSEPSVALGTYPEVRFSNPKSGYAPVEAFYFVNEEGRQGALKNAAEYKQLTGIDVPVIQLHFPTNMNEKMTFSCDVKPQPEAPTAPATGATAEELAAGGWGTGSNPNQCSSYIQSVVWINRYDFYLGRHVDSVSVVPTDCGRQIGPDQTDAAFAELKQKAIALPDGQRKWNNRDGTLRRQFVCHITLVSNGLPVRNKREYNLEPIRREVSHEQSLADGCNTPLTDDGVIGGWGQEGAPQCSQYVQSVKWVPRKFGEYGNQTVMSLEITPTECGRKIGADQTDKLMAEVKQKALAADPRGKDYWANNKDLTMRRQTVCLMIKHRYKDTWNVEPIRPALNNQDEMNAADCNPK